MSLHGIDTASGSYATANAVTYTSIMACQYMNIFSLRTRTSESVFTPYLWSNKKLLWAFVMSFVGILILIYVPVVRDYLSFGSMTLGDWLFPLAAGILYLAIRELKKMLMRRKEVIVPVETVQVAAGING